MRQYESIDAVVGGQLAW